MNTRFERLKAKLAGRMPVAESPKIDWQAVLMAQAKRLYTGVKAPHIALLRSGKEGWQK